jgi:hypothetical protein
MRTSNETRLNSTGGAAAGLAAVRTLPVSDRVKQAAACAYESDPLHDPRWAALGESHPRASLFHSKSG